MPKWKRENGCYSCHNNGDGLRALIAAQRAGFEVDAKVIEESLAALRPPGGDWEAKPLARLQRAMAVREAVAAGLLDRQTLEDSAALVARDQQSDGHWQVEDELAAVGSPVTYGPVLATYLACEVLKASGTVELHASAIRRARRWLTARKPAHVLDLAVLVLALGREPDRQKLVAAQLPNASWNNEPFDTAMARLALGASHPASKRARAFLIGTQWSGGGWPATTRPAGGDSYAQHISTTAWALISLSPSAAATERR